MHFESKKCTDIQANFSKVDTTIVALCSSVALLLQVVHFFSLCRIKIFIGNMEAIIHCQTQVESPSAPIATVTFLTMVQYFLNSSCTVILGSELTLSVKQF